jgi:hypothetical protein
LSLYKLAVTTESLSKSGVSRVKNRMVSPGEKVESAGGNLNFLLSAMTLEAERRIEPRSVQVIAEIYILLLASSTMLNHC